MGWVANGEKTRRNGRKKQRMDGGREQEGERAGG